MNVEIFALCDSATNAQGKLNLLGTFDTIWAVKQPILHLNSAIAIRLRFNRIEQGTHRVRVRVLDEDGHPTHTLLEQDIPVRISGQESSGTLNVVITLQRLELPRYGAYTIDLAVNEQHAMSLPLYARAAPTAPSPFGNPGP